LLFGLKYLVEVLNLLGIISSFVLSQVELLALLLVLGLVEVLVLT
jgi:hypothetical protein